MDTEKHNVDPVRPIRGNSPIRANILFSPDRMDHIRFRLCSFEDEVIDLTTISPNEIYSSI